METRWFTLRTPYGKHRRDDITEQAVDILQQLAESQPDGTIALRYNIRNRDPDGGYWYDCRIAMIRASNGFLHYGERRLGVHGTPDHQWLRHRMPPAEIERDEPMWADNPGAHDSVGALLQTLLSTLIEYAAHLWIGHEELLESASNLLILMELAK